MYKTTLHYLKVFAACAMCAALLTACGGSPGNSTAAQDSAAYGYDAAPEMSAAESMEENGIATAGGGMESSLTAPQDGRKIIMTATLQMQALEFDDILLHIQQTTQQHGGYVSDSSMTNYGTGAARSASYTLRIPAENYAAFLADVQKQGNTVTLSESSEDITSQYVDVESRLAALRTQEARLLEMMEQAGDLESLLLIQQQLAEVQYEIEWYTSSIRGMDDKISYSTVYIHLSEVVEYTEPVPETYGSRIASAFANGWKGFVRVVGDIGVTLVYLLPLLVLAAIAVPVIVVLRRRAKKRAALKPKPQPPVYGAYPGMPPMAPQQPTAHPAQESTKTPQEPK